MSSPLSSPVPSRRKCDPPRIPRPLNCFFLFRSSRVQEINEQRRITGRTEDQAMLSKILAKEWNSLPRTQKEVWMEKANREKHLHAQRYPQYRYHPVRNKSKRASKQKKVKKLVNNNSRISTESTRNLSLTDGNPPHLDSTPSNAVDSNGHALSLHPPTWLYPPTSHQSLLPLWNTPLEFVNPDQLSGTAFPGIYLPGFEYYT